MHTLRTWSTTLGTAVATAAVLLGAGFLLVGGFSLLHTHAADGVIHIEAPAKVQFTLGQFFDVWRQRLDRRNLGPVRGRVVAYVNGRRYRTIPLRRHAQIQLEVGRPGVPPAPIGFPPGL
jgi:hypothetical protein